MKFHTFLTLMFLASMITLSSMTAYGQDTTDEISDTVTEIVEENPTQQSRWSVLWQSEIQGERHLSNFGVTIADGTPVSQNMILACRSGKKTTFCVDVWNATSLGDSQDAIYETDLEAELTFHNVANQGFDFSAKVAVFEIRGIDEVYQVRAKIIKDLGNGFSTAVSSEFLKGGFEAELYRASLSYNGTEGMIGYGVEGALAYNTNDNLEGLIIPMTGYVSYDFGPATASLYAKAHVGERDDTTFGIRLGVPIK